MKDITSVGYRPGEEHVSRPRGRLHRQGRAAGGVQAPRSCQSLSELPPCLVDLES